MLYLEFPANLGIDERNAAKDGCQVNLIQLIRSFETPARLASGLGALLFLFAIADRAAAGLSGENVAVVVNGDSVESRTIANHYIHLRKIPTKNVVVINDVPDGFKTDLESFREKILRPVLSQLDARGIANQTNVIAYSAGFPTAVTIPEHHARVEDENTKKYQRPTASLTGLTYFYRFVLNDKIGYLSFGANLYARGTFSRHFTNPFTNETGEEFKRAVELFEQEKFSEAAEIWRVQFEKNPSISGVGIRAAEAYSLADDSENAVKLIRSAIQSGWWSATYLKQTPSLDKHLDDAVISRLMPFLDDSPIAWQGPVEFAAGVGWSLTGDPVQLAAGGIPYLCSCSLAIVDPRASTMSQAVGVLKRAARSDRTFPQGRFAFGASKNVRATTRFPGVANSMLYLQANGFETEVFRGNLPTKGGLVAGMMTGFSKVDLGGGPWVFAPGAIAENLTSYGGVYDLDRGHTLITDFLHEGACMSSGAVEEPFSLPHKFPMPMMYGFYAMGLSAIESFYQSVASPYQLLIVGDPLTQPFAKAPDDTIDISLINEPKRRIRISRRTLGLSVPKTKTRSIRISLNDRLFQTTLPVPNIDINLPEEASGVWDVRATLSGYHRTGPKLTFTSEVELEGPLPAPVATIITPRTGAEGDGNTGVDATPVEVELAAEGADQITLMHLGTVVGKVDGAKGKVEVETNGLGGGPLRFRPVAQFGDQTVIGKAVVDVP